jgi:tetratricopeptide (TPR) repeat protein
MAVLKGLLRERKYAEALAAAESYLREKPRHVGLLSAAASAAFALGRNEEALQFIRRALYIQPESEVLKDSLRKIQKRIDEQGESS